jgi:hypothetical protein
MTRQRTLLSLALSRPDELLSFTLPEWDQVVRQAREIGLLGTIQSRIDRAGLLGQVPSVVRVHLEGARNIALSHERAIRWEVHCIQKAIAGVQTEIILLKGAAYTLSGLSNARGRLQSDVDILVPKSRLKAVEAALLEHGWKGLKLEKYDQRFYRQWSHEIPPLIHEGRGTVVDVHHNILPVTGRLHPNAEKLLEAASPILGTPFKSLSPSDMVLHVSAHMFQAGDLMGGLRELVDVDGLTRTFSSLSGFWEKLADRATEITLHRPLFYALRYSSFYLGTPISPNVLSAMNAWAPPRPVVNLMDRLVSKSLMPKNHEVGSSAARWFLYGRSHWLSMPPIMLTRHLMHQTLKRVLK